MDRRALHMSYTTRLELRFTNNTCFTVMLDTDTQAGDQYLEEFANVPSTAHVCSGMS